MPYMPPELLSQSQLTPKADVYSFGIVMWELLSGQVGSLQPASTTCHISNAASHQPISRKFRRPRAFKLAECRSLWLTRCHTRC